MITTANETIEKKNEELEQKKHLSSRNLSDGIFVVALFLSLFLCFIIIIIK